MLQRDKGLEYAAVLVRELLAVRVLLYFSLTRQALPTAALEGEDLVSEQVCVADKTLVDYWLLLLLLLLPHGWCAISSTSPRPWLHHHL